MITFYYIKRHIIPVVSCLIIGFGATQSAASQLYRYKNDQGVIVLGQAIPAKHVAQGYEILNEKGRVIERIPPALTEEQIKQRDAELEYKKQLQIAREAQEKIDEKLKQLYSHPDDAVRILERRIQDIVNVIQVKTGKIESAGKRIITQEEQAASLQRKGLKIPESILESIDTLKKDVVNAEADIKELKQDYMEVLNEFDTKIKRLEHITRQKSANYTSLLESLKNNPDLQAAN